MTRIDFYQIDSEEKTLVFACRLLEKIYRQGGQRVHVHTSDNNEARQLDDLLWSFRPDHFIPHCLLGAGQQAPITIGHQQEPVAEAQILVNLSGSVPDFFSRFERVAEVVPFEPSRRQASRVNYKFYKDRGYPLYHHRIKERQ